jgi:hypothetical protein
MPIWLQVVLAVLVPASALGGVWLGARLSTQQADTQWRRDRLLQFCSDLIAACHEVWGSKITSEARSPWLSAESPGPARISRRGAGFSGVFAASSFARRACD